MCRFVLYASFMATVACSQRSPWVVVPAPQAGESPGHATAAPIDAALIASIGMLHFPVAGFDGRSLNDSFEDPRDGGARRHHAIDILAPLGTPVLSVQNGRVLRLSHDPRGGITIYATSPDERFVFYYAHLDRYHGDLREGQSVARGDTIGYVGTTGNASQSVPHLHFQLMRMPPDRKYWNGDPINPYPLLRASSPDTAGKWR